MCPVQLILDLLVTHQPIQRLHFLYRLILNTVLTTNYSIQHGEMAERSKALHSSFIASSEPQFEKYCSLFI
jgi:hypothetical protein